MLKNLLINHYSCFDAAVTDSHLERVTGGEKTAIVLQTQEASSGA